MTYIGANLPAERMKSCGGEAYIRATDWAGAFMSAWLPGKNNPATMMKVCNAQATQNRVTGDARSAYISGCLKTGS